MLRRTISIKGRIAVAVGFLAALLLITGTLGLMGMSHTNTALQETATGQMPSATNVANAEIYAARARLALDRAALMTDAAEAKPVLDRARMLYSTSESWWQKYLALARDGDQDRLAQDVKRAREVYANALARFAAVIESGDRPAFVDHANQLQVAYNKLSQADDALGKFQAESAEHGLAEARSNYLILRLVTIVALCAGLCAALAAYLTLRRAIGAPLAEALQHFEAIAGGDLRRTIVSSSSDEMGQLLQGVSRMQQRLTETVRSVRTGSESIASATKEIAAGNSDLSSRTEEQASALQETASSMEQLTGTVRHNADSARQASALASSASEIANKGNDVVTQVVGTMGEISRSSTRIADIISIIEGIAFQTNILALNAAVEAARAGEEGRGFAVVAGEVRTLAQRSSAAAKEIKELIDSSVACVNTGSTLVHEAGNTMNEIISAVQRVTDIMGEIAAASEEQSAGIDQVARAVTQMDEVTQQNAALVEQAAAAAQSLDDQATKLQQAVSVFSVGAAERHHA
ncbi:methyl-accepting chemotaxis protein [Caballeronia ptereochthonis]|uniref:Methyl-accepting chemotaxis sensory transducer n=1 Tax=Caballeronia ptereochthonis TaxID=1777144 RepID=A0A158AIJ9_9BURK|nr:methyl-accepting chemotaxis protein [Caballeronia ptereochthonis]SAK57602.1 methyl-accepting chemotaxis sensory transducer [Caballeronia ptereochthonis]